MTVLMECVFDAFEVEAYDYLLKPLDSVHFRQTMDRAMPAGVCWTVRHLCQRSGQRGPWLSSGPE